jgi:hypothetical protein
MKNLKRSAAFGLSFLIALLVAAYCIPSRGDGANFKAVSITAEFDNGSKKVLTVKYPEYASLGIHQSRGGHRLSTWEYCAFKGVFRCENTLVYGVVWFDYN